MTEILKENLINNLFKTADKYLDEFLTTGSPKLERLIGNEIYYKNYKTRSYCWNNENIDKLTVDDLVKICNTIEKELKKVLIKNRTAFR